MKKHLEVVGGVFVRDGRVLAAKRGESRCQCVAHKYEFVGGKIQANEEREAALVREVKEELHADARVLRHFMTLSHEYTDFSVTLYLYFAEFLTDYENTEHESLEWFCADELIEESWAPADVPAVAALKKLLAESAPNSARSEK